MTDYAYLALSLANLSAIPVRLYRDGSCTAGFHSTTFSPDLADLEAEHIFRSPANVSYYMTEEFLFYGLFRVKDADVCMVLGPVAQIPVDRARAERILRAAGEPTARAVELQNYLATIPSYPLRNFLQILCTFSYVLNGEKLSVGDILLEELEQPAFPDPPVKQDSELGHNTYELEQALLSYIEHGRPKALEFLFQQPATGRAGTMAHDTLRQQKNLLIVTATLASRAAIRGGMRPEAAFALSDLYIQKAELLSSYEGLVKLSMQMTMDYARKVAALQCGDSNRKLLRDARQYILAHLDERLSTELLAEALGRNRTYLCACFKEETGLSVNEYITKLRIDEAKRLLKVTGKPLRLIAEQVGYSSQSYFQRVFKKTEGKTPLEYRKR